MVTAYYIMTLTKNRKNIDTEKYYTGLQSSPKLAVKRQLKCRVCLQDGALNIARVENYADIKDALKIFGDIEVGEDDKNPKRLCNVCYQFLRSAILFRKVAQRTNEALKRPVKLEIPEPIDDSNIWNGYENNADTFDDDDNKSVHSMNDEELLAPLRRRKYPKIQCKTCKKHFTRRYYKIHITMHNPEHQNEYVCDICGKSFRLRDSHHNHRLRHRTDYAYKCQFCPFKARYTGSLKSHMRTHTRDYRYMCSQCPAKFLYSSNLNSHFLLKHKEREFKCEVCERAFPTEIYLQRHHDADHLGIKNHVCSTCGQAFGYRNALMKHQRRVHKRERLKPRFGTLKYKPDNNKETV